MTTAILEKVWQEIVFFRFDIPVFLVEATKVFFLNYKVVTHSANFAPQYYSVESRLLLYITKHLMKLVSTFENKLSVPRPFVSMLY